VRVPRFGEGTVAASDALTVTIDFPKGRRRSFLAEYVEAVEPSAAPEAATAQALATARAGTALGAQAA
jgi:hypothetical protein